MKIGKFEVGDIVGIYQHRPEEQRRINDLWSIAIILNITVEGSRPVVEIANIHSLWCTDIYMHRSATERTCYMEHIGRDQ